MQQMHSDIIVGMANVQIRDVPDDVHRRLKAQAASSGRSLNEHLLAQLTEIASTPTLTELTERLRRLPPYRGGGVAEVIREDRDRP
jgi:plasmid stability protein